MGADGRDGVGMPHSQQDLGHRPMGWDRTSCNSAVHEPISTSNPTTAAPIAAKHPLVLTAPAPNQNLAFFDTVCKAAVATTRRHHALLCAGSVPSLPRLLCQPRPLLLEKAPLGMQGLQHPAVGKCKNHCWQSILFSSRHITRGSMKSLL